MRLFSCLLFVLLLALSSGIGTTAPLTFSMEGKIIDANGNPVEGADVYLYRTKNVKKPADFISTKTGVDGLYKAILPVGRYFAVAIFREKGNKFGPLGEGDRHSGEPTEIEVNDHLVQDFEIIDIREAARKVQKRNEDLFQIRGRLTDSSGVPVRDSYAMAGTAKKFKDIPGYVSAWTDSSGEYTLFMPKGRYYLGSARVFPPGQDSLQEKELDLDKDVDGVDLVVNGE